MLSSLALAAFACAGISCLAAMAVRDHRAAMAARAKLLDAAAGLLTDSRHTIRRDGFPALSGRLQDGRRIEIGLVPDTLVVRRLPQLWLTVTLREAVEARQGSIGALARPTGAEFYSVVHDLPERIETPPGLDPEILVRGDGRLTAAQIRRAGEALRGIFADPRVKEAAATPQGVRIVRQVAEGARGAHLLLRQSDFALVTIATDSVLKAVADADALRDALGTAALPTARLTA